jgi:hypothetical protein
MGVASLVTPIIAAIAIAGSTDRPITGISLAETMFAIWVLQFFWALVAAHASSRVLKDHRRRIRNLAARERPSRQEGKGR